MADKFHLIPVADISNFTEPECVVIDWQIVEGKDGNISVVVQTRSNTDLINLGQQLVASREEVQKARRAYAYLGRISEAPDNKDKPELEIVKTAMALLRGEPDPSMN